MTMFIHQRPIEVLKPERMPFAVSARKLDPDVLASRGIDMRLAGVRRILIEAEVSGRMAKGEPTKRVRTAARQYQHLVTSISHRLRQYASELGRKPEDAELYIFIARRMHEMRITYDNGDFLLDNVRDRKLDCDNRSFLVYDVMKAVGLKGYGVGSIDRHVFVTGLQLDFETTRPPEAVQGVTRLHSKRPENITVVTSEPILDAMVYSFAVARMIEQRKITAKILQNAYGKLLNLFDEAQKEAPDSSENIVQIASMQREIGHGMVVIGLSHYLKGTDISTKIIGMGKMLEAMALANRKKVESLRSAERENRRVG